MLGTFAKLDPGLFVYGRPVGGHISRTQGRGAKPSHCGQNVCGRLDFSDKETDLFLEGMAC